MAKKTERMIYFYDLFVRATAAELENPNPLSVREAFTLLDRLTPEQRKLARANSLRSYAITDWELQANRVFFIINLSDKTVADPFFSDHPADARRKVEKKDTEGHEFSAHVVVKFPQNAVDPATMLIEKSTGVTAHRVMTVLRQLLRRVRNIDRGPFYQKHPDGAVDKNGKEVFHLVNYHFDAEGHLSKKMQQDLNEGRVSGVELVTSRHREEPFDKEAYLVNKESVIILKVNDKHPGVKDKLRKLTEVFESKKNQFEKARIRFTTTTGTVSLIEWDSENGVSDQYIRKEHIKNIHPPMESSYVQFRRDLLERMVLL